MSPIPGKERAGEIYPEWVGAYHIESPRLEASIERIVNSERSEFGIGKREFNQPFLIFSRPFGSEGIKITVEKGIELAGVSFDDIMNIGDFVSGPSEDEPREVGRFDQTLVSPFDIGISFLREEEQIEVWGNWENASSHRISCGPTLFSPGYEIWGRGSLDGESFLFQEELGGLLAILKILPEGLFEKAGEGVFVTELKDGVPQTGNALLALPAGEIRKIWERVRGRTNLKVVLEKVGDGVLCPIPTRIVWPVEERTGFFGARRVKEKARLVENFLRELQDERVRPVGVVLLP